MTSKLQSNLKLQRIITQKPPKIHLIQKISCQRVCRQDILDQCSYIMQQVQNKNKINVNMVSDLPYFIELFNDKITK